MVAKTPRNLFQGDIMHIDGYRQWAIGSLYAQFGQIQPAINAYHRALWGFRLTKDTRNTARMLNRLGELYARYGDLTTTQYLCQLAAQHFHQVQDRAGAIAAVRNVAMVHYQRQRPQQAISLLTEVIEDCEAIGDSFNEAVTLTCLAQVYASQQQYLFALACDEAAIEHFQHIEDFDRLDDATDRLAACLSHMGHICQRTGHPDIAIQRYTEALPIFYSRNITADILATLSTLCQLHEGLGQYTQALTYRQQALDYELTLNRWVRSH